MAVHVSADVARAVPAESAGGLSRGRFGGRCGGRGGLAGGLRARLAAASLDARLAAGEDPRSDSILARRATQLLSVRARRRLAAGLERVSSSQRDGPDRSAAIPFDRRAVHVARPVLEQLARALRSRDQVDPRGVAVAERLLTEPESALYRPAFAEELYEVARAALFALGPDAAAGRRHDGGRVRL